MAHAYVCVACGTQFTETSAPPPRCPVCEDERQFVPRTGQQWTILDKIRRTHRNRIEIDAGVTTIFTEPKFAIGQRALLVAGPDGNILWDCISLLDEATIAEVRRHGPLKAIAISHPHYYATMVEWSRAFGGVPIYLHAADRQWIMRPDRAIVSWDGPQISLGEGLSLIRCGGHFSGGTVLHRAGVADEPGTLFTGDILTVTADRHVSFMWSYPNYIPLSAAAVEGIVRAIDPLEFDRIYGAFTGDVILADGKPAVAISVARYLKALARKP